MFTKADPYGTFTVVSAYVDDFLVAGNSLSSIGAVKHFISTIFTIKDLGPLKYFLGIEVWRNSSGILPNQRKYIINLLKDTSVQDCTVTSSPFPQNLSQPRNL